MKDLLETPGARIACFGDSLTSHGWWLIEAERLLNKRFPALDLTMLNVGVGGDTLHGALRRFDWDVPRYRPTHVFIGFGANDSRYTSYKRGGDHTELIAGRSGLCETYTKALNDCIELCRSHGFEPIVGTPTAPFDDGISPVDNGKVNGILEMFTECARRTAEETGCLFVDLHHPMKRFHESWRGGADDLYRPDRLHLLKDGHRVLGLVFAGELTRALTGEEPAPLPTCPDEIETYCGEFTKAMDERWSHEQIIRSAAHFRSDAAIRGWDTGTVEETILRGFEEFDKPDSPEFRRKEVICYAVWRDHLDELFTNLEVLIRQSKES